MKKKLRLYRRRNSSESLLHKERLTVHFYAGSAHTSQSKKAPIAHIDSYFILNAFKVISAWAMIFNGISRVVAMWTRKFNNPI